MNSLIRTAAAAALIIGAGILHGSWTNRWGASRELAALGARFESVPMVLGDWKATSFELPTDEREMAGAVACVARRYTNPTRGVSVTVLLLGGLPGKIGTHTPDVCLPGAGFALGEASQFNRGYGSPERRAGLRTLLATRSGPSPSVVRMFWGWNASKGWSAPEEPRFTFANEPALCKLYVSRETAGAIADPKDDPCNEFLTLLLPAIDQLVFRAASPPA
jgi:hypothetical protein